MTAKARVTGGSRRADEGRQEPARAVQLFSDAYLERCRQLSPDDIVRFLEEFRHNFVAAQAARAAASRRQRRDDG